MFVVDTLTHTHKNLSFCKYIRMYVCGSTVYDNSHLGHIRLFLFFDLVVRYLYFYGVDIVLVRNITDIDEKIVKKIQERCCCLLNVTNKYIFSMYKDCHNFNIMQPTFEPAATSFVQHMLQLIDVLLNIEAAYVSCNGDVFYDVSTNNLYGKLSSQKLTELHFGVRIVVECSKRSSVDFVLWKLVTTVDSVVWDSKWGQGRPGWHIECSAMVVYFFGENVTVHGGGVDLVFPHHENECAQTESIFKKKYTDVWLHVGLVLVKQQKMSKSFFNFVKVKNLLRVFKVDVIKYFLLQSHYKKPVEYKLNKLHLCSVFLEKVSKLFNFFKVNIEFFVIRFEEVYKTSFYTEFLRSISYDYNTPIVLKKIQDFVDIVFINKKRNLFKECLFLVECLIVVGMSVGLFFKHDYKLNVALRSSSVYNKAFLICKLRRCVRLQQQWLLSDVLRDVLYVSGFVVEDLKE